MIRGSGRLDGSVVAVRARPAAEPLEARWLLSVTVAAGLNAPTQLAVEDGNVYFVDGRSGPQDTLAAVPVSGGAMATLLTDAATGDGGIGGYAVDADGNVTGAYGGSGLLTVFAVPAGGAAATLGTAAGGGAFLGTFGDEAYVAVGAGGAIEKAPLAGGAATPLGLNGFVAGAVADDGLGAYFANLVNGDLDRLNFNGGSVSILSTGNPSPAGQVVVDLTEGYSEDAYANFPDGQIVSIGFDDDTVLPAGLRVGDTLLTAAGPYLYEAQGNLLLRRATSGGEAVIFATAPVGDTIASAAVANGVLYWTESDGTAGDGSIRSADATGGPYSSSATSPTTHYFGPVAVIGDFLLTPAGQESSNGTADLLGGGTNDLVQVQGTTTFDTQTLAATGAFTALVGGTATPLFNGTMTVPYESSGGNVTDDGTAPHLTVAGVQPVFQTVSLPFDGTLSATGTIPLPATVGGATFAVPVDGSFGLGDDGIQLDATADSVPVVLGGQLDATIAPATLTYDAPTDRLELQGPTTVAVNGGTLTGDLSGGSGGDLSFSATAASLDGGLTATGSVPLVPGITLTGVGVSLDTTAGAFAVTATVSAGPQTATVTPTLAGGSVESLPLDLDASADALPFGFSLRRVVGTVQYLAPADAQGVVLDGAVAVSYGTATSLPLPADLGGPIPAADPLYVDGAGSLTRAGTLSITGTLAIGADEATGATAGTSPVTFALDTADGIFTAPVDLTGFAGDVTFNGSLSDDPATGVIAGTGTGSVAVPGSLTVAGGTGEFRYDPASLTDSYFAAYRTVTARTGVGVRIDLTGQASPSDPPLATAGAPSSFTVPPRTAGVLFAASWTDPDPGGSLQLRSPSGQLYSAADLARGGRFDTPAGLQSDRSAAVAVRGPVPGVWTVIGPDPAAAGTTGYAGVVLAGVPVIRVTEPVGQTAAPAAGVRFAVGGAAAAAAAGDTVTVYADRGRQLTGTPVAEGLPVNARGFIWTAAGVPGGTYSFYAEVTGPETVPAYAYAPGTVSTGTTALSVSISVPPSVRSGVRATVSVTITNVGGATVPRLGTVQLLSDEVPVNPGIGVPFGSRTLAAALRPGAARTVVFPVDFGGESTGQAEYLDAKVTGSAGSVVLSPVVTFVVSA